MVLLRNTCWICKVWENFPECPVSLALVRVLTVSSRWLSMLLSSHGYSRAVGLSRTQLLESFLKTYRPVPGPDVSAAVLRDLQDGQCRPLRPHKWSHTVRVCTEPLCSHHPSYTVLPFSAVWACFRFAGVCSWGALRLQPVLSPMKNPGSRTCWLQPS